MLLTTHIVVMLSLEPLYLRKMWFLPIVFYVLCGIFHADIYTKCSKLVSGDLRYCWIHSTGTINAVSSVQIYNKCCKFDYILHFVPYKTTFYVVSCYVLCSYFSFWISTKKVASYYTNCTNLLLCML